MAGQILESVERGIVQRLLRIADIFEAYTSRVPLWATFYETVIHATGELRDQGGNPVIYSGREIVRMTVPLLGASSETLLDSIRRLEHSDVESETNVFARLRELSLPSIGEPDRKGLFLLAARFGEESDLFDTADQDDESTSDSEAEADGENSDNP